MDKILYYPYISLPRTDWTLRALLYYENIGSIVPQEYFYDPARYYDPFMLELVRNELVMPVDPIEALDDPWNVMDSFMEYISNNEQAFKRPRFKASITGNSYIHEGKFQGKNIHADKFHQNLFYQLEQMGLAVQGEGRWYKVERRTADLMMKFLATVVGAKLDMLPTTDSIGFKLIGKKEAVNQQRRETILTHLIPFPEDIDLGKVRKFKDKHPDLLRAFKNRIETLVLDPIIKEGTDLFNERVDELKLRRDELSAKMNESQFKKILFGTVCGIFGAVQGFSTAETTGVVLGALPGFAHAVYSALQVERPEDTFDQSGLKYLALMDKRLTIRLEIPLKEYQRSAAKSTA